MGGCWRQQERGGGQNLKKGWEVGNIGGLYKIGGLRPSANYDYIGPWETVWGST